MKQEKTRDKKMPDIPDTGACARVDDLVGYLYGETNESEALDFQNHITTCGACSAELSAFADVRACVIAWRDDALNPMAVLASDGVRHRVVAESVTGRSALVALREFFILSPLWLRGATAFATVLFVALLCVTALRFFEHSETPVVQQTPSIAPLNEKEAPTVKKAKDELVAAPPAIMAPNKDVRVRMRQTKLVETRTSARTKSYRRANAPVLSNEERSQLSDLLIAANEDEESVPRLYDLLSESN